MELSGSLQASAPSAIVHNLVVNHAFENLDDRP